MKIFYIYTALLTQGGADRVLTEKANYLAEHGYEVGIITDTQMGRPPVFPLSPKVKLINLDIDFNKEYGHNIVVRTMLYYQLMRQYKRAMARVFRQEKPDIIITTMGRDLDFLTDISGSATVIGEAHTTKHFLRNFHLMEQRGGVYSLIVKWWRKKMERNTRKLSALVLLTKEDADSWKGTTRTYVIPNSLPFNPGTTSTLANKQAIAVGRYNNAKGYKYMIEAWRLVYQQHPDWKINIYGSGELKEQVRALIHEYGLQDVMIMNEPTDDIMQKYLESSICVVSSRYEGFSMVLLEAMACGVPCVAFDCPHGPRNILHNGEDGFLVKYLDTAELARHISLLMDDEQLRQQIGRKAKANIQRYAQEAVMKQWTDLFETLKQ